jgi:hypothetical protein
MSTPIRVAHFAVDVTPPLGHPLCGGWMDPAVALADRVEAQGVVLLGDEAPVVLLAIEWCEISNRSHMTFRGELARAVGTTADRVAVHCTHPHCTPWPDDTAQDLVDSQPGLRPVMDRGFFQQTVGRVAAAARAALAAAQPVSHLGLGSARVQQVASNRRILGPDGKVKAVRWTATRDPAVRAEPEGLIDPLLRSISFWNGQRELVALHYYAVHPTSYDNDSTITPDFTGLARQRLQAQRPDTRFVYFNACAGNITAGKYNDGSPENRPVLAQRMFEAMAAAEASSTRHPIRSLRWLVEPVSLPIHAAMPQAQLERELADDKLHAKFRIRAAMELAYRRRVDQPIPFTCLHLDDVASIVHLPGESFIEYQLLAQELAPQRMVAVASYGDCGPGYICLERSFAEGGYEPRDSFVDGTSERLMRQAIRRLVTG